MSRFRRGRARAAVVVAGALLLLGMYQGASTGSAGPDSVAKALKLSQERVDAINDVTDVPAVQQNLVPADSDWQESFEPCPYRLGYRKPG